MLQSDLVQFLADHLRIELERDGRDIKATLYLQFVSLDPVGAPTQTVVIDYDYVDIREFTET